MGLWRTQSWRRLRRQSLLTRPKASGPTITDGHFITSETIGQSYPLIAHVLFGGAGPEIRRRCTELSIFLMSLRVEVEGPGAVLLLKRIRRATASQAPGWLQCVGRSW